MSSTDIVIYEKDSVDVTFTLDESNEIITTFLATDTILLAIKNDTEGHAIILKDKTGVTGATVTFSLTKQDTARLHPQKYYYDITVLKGDTQQTTVLKAGKFVVASRGVKTNDKAELTLDKLTQYNLIASGIQANATSAQQSATSASNSATSASNTLSSVQALATSTSSQINQAVSTVTSAKETVQGALGNIESASANAVSSINSTKASAITEIQQAGATAKTDSTLVRQYAQQAQASATSASSSATTASNAATTATESSNAAHRYANQILAVSDEITEKAAELLDVVEDAKSDVETIRAETENLTAAASATQANVAAAQQAETNAQTYAQQASASATSASNSASTATTKASQASSSATSASTSASQASTSASNASTSASNAQTYAEQAETYASNASASATQAGTSASQASTYASNASSSATSAASNADAVANQVSLARGYASSASQSATDAQNSAESVQNVVSQVNTNTSNIALKANTADLAAVAFTGDYANLINKPNISSSGGGNAYELLKQDFAASNWSLQSSGMYQYGASHADIVDVYRLDTDGTYHKMVVAIHKPSSGSATLYCTTAFDGYYTYGTNLTAVTDSEGNNILTTYATKTELASKADSSSVYTKTAADTLYSGKLNKAGDTMSGDLTFNVGRKLIIKQETTSNYTPLCVWYKGGVTSADYTYNAQIGHYNMGDTDGSITILPYQTNSYPYGQSVGLYVSKNLLKFNGNDVLLKSNYNIDNVGTIVTATATSINYSSGTTTEACTTTLGAGKWVILGKVSFANTVANQRYHIQFTTNASATSHADKWNANMWARNNNEFLEVKTQGIIELSSTKTLYLLVYATGNATIIQSDIEAIRIR